MKLLLVVFITFLYSGCSFKLGHFSIISTNDVNMSKKYVKGDKLVTGKDSLQIYFLIPSKLRNSISKSVENALKKTCASYLTNVEATLNYWYIPYIYGKQWIEVRGTPWYLKNKQKCDKD